MESLETKIIKSLVNNDLYPEWKLKKELSQDLYEKYQNEKNNIHKMKTVNIYKRITFNLIDGITLLNNTYNLCDFSLDEWSHNVKDHLNESQNEKIFEEIYDKMYNVVNIPPEIRLLSLIVEWIKNLF